MRVANAAGSDSGVGSLRMGIVRGKGGGGFFGWWGECCC